MEKITNSKQGGKKWEPRCFQRLYIYILTQATLKPKTYIESVPHIGSRFVAESGSLIGFSRYDFLGHSLNPDQVLFNVIKLLL